MVSLRRGLLLAPILLSFCYIIAAFQSDELQDDDDEWGIVGIKNNNNINNHLEQVTDRSPQRPSKVSSSDGSSSAPSSSSDTKVAFQLEHSFGDSADFSQAGTFTARLRNLHHGGQTLTKLRLTRNAFTTNEEEAFETLVQADGFYRIRVPANVLSPGQGMILSSIKARCLAAVNLHERFEFYMDRGNIIAVAYGASDCVYPRETKIPTTWSFDSHIVMKSGEQASRAPVVNNEIEVELGEDGQPKKPVEKTFWQKYWLYIVPLVFIVLNVVTQAANMPDESTNSQGGAPQRAVAGGGPRRR